MGHGVTLLPFVGRGGSRQTVRVAMTVWVDGWQLQCCGDPFKIGSRVSWTLVTVDIDRLTKMLGPGVKIDATEEHHGGVPEDTPEATGTVVGIEAVHCRYESAPGENGPVPVSVTRTAITSADGWTADKDDLKFVGYLVKLAR